MKTMKVMSKVIAIVMCAVFVLGTSVPVSAHECGELTETSTVLATGVLEDGTPYTVYAIASNGENVNIIDSRPYEIKVTFPWGTTPPSTFNVAIPINGNTYKGTLDLNMYMNNIINWSVDAYYKGVIIGVI